MAGAVHEPGTLNRYAYVGGNPSNHTDTSGREVDGGDYVRDCAVGGTVGGAIGAGIGFFVGSFAGPAGTALGTLGGYAAGYVSGCIGGLIEAGLQDLIEEETELW